MKDSMPALLCKSARKICAGSILGELLSLAYDCAKCNMSNGILARRSEYLSIVSRLTGKSLLIFRCIHEGAKKNKSAGFLCTLRYRQTPAITKGSPHSYRSAVPLLIVTANFNWRFLEHFNKKHHYQYVVEKPVCFQVTNLQIIFR